MLWRRVSMMLTLSLMVIWNTSVYGQDVATLQASKDLEDLRSSFAADMNALNSRNLTAALAAIDDHLVLFGIFSPFPITGKEQYRQAVQEYFENYDRAVITPVEPEYKIIGATGIAWGNFRLATRHKGEAQKYADGRYMLTYTRANGKWRTISMHYSLLEPIVK